MTFRIQHRNTIRNVRIMIRTLRMVGIDAPTRRSAPAVGVPPEASAPPGHLVGRALAMDRGAAVVIGDVIAREGAVAAWSIPGSVVRGAGRCRRTPTSPASWTAVTATEAGVQAGAGGCPASEVLPLSAPRFPAETRRQVDASRVCSRVPPSTCRPPTIVSGSNTCAKIGGVVSYERAPKRCPNGHRLGPHRVVVGWTPCTCATALRPSGATGHRTYRQSSAKRKSSFRPTRGHRSPGCNGRRDRHRSNRGPTRQASEPAGSQTRRPTGSRTFSFAEIVV